MHLSFLRPALLVHHLSLCRAASSSRADQPGAPRPFEPDQQQHPLIIPPPTPGLELEQHVAHPVTSTSNFQARGFVALGDSYSTGIGTGVDEDLLPSEGDCRLGQHGYPMLLHLDLNKRTGTNTTLQWLSCTGSRTTDILAGPAPATPGQVGTLDPSLPLDFATLSVGGNDLGFFDVMNACIFRFYAQYSGTCKAALADADAALRDGAFARRLDLVLREVLDRAGWERRPGFTITVTGYARFFDDATPACDDMSLGVWLGRGPPLSRAVRARTNALVLAANELLAAAVRDAAARFRGPRPRVLFVDYDARFHGHRFCEPGVAEPAYGRSDSWFFLAGGPDNVGNKSTWPNGTDGTDGDPPPAPPVPPGPSPELEQRVLRVEPEACLAGARARGDWGELVLCYMATARARDPSLRLAAPAHLVDVTPQDGLRLTPTHYAKTFHPRSMGCEAIRDSIYEAWTKYGL